MEMEVVAGEMEEERVASTQEHSLSSRSVQQVASTAAAAGLKDSVGEVDTLHFSPSLHAEDIKLLELPGSVLSALKTGEQ